MTNLPPVGPLHPPRVPSSCSRHPHHPITGFCASCLRERLSGLETTSSSAPKSIFLPPELRRCKSFSSIRATHEANKEKIKTMKDFIHLESNPPPKQTHNTSFSLFSKKLQKWRRTRQKIKKNEASSIKTETTHNLSHRFSCDIEPRFSFMSVDDPRLSWDVPRASWDGHLIGGRSMLARLPSMVALGEDAHVPVERWDGRIPVEEDKDAAIPGGSVQTRDYYLDSSSSRRRRSLDRSDSSTRKQSIEVSNGPDFFHVHNETNQEDFTKKKSSRWSKAWNLWGFIYRRGSSRGVAGNEVERTLSATWPELREQVVYNGKVFDSGVSTRTCLHNNAGFGSMRRSNVVLEKNRSANYSPSHVDHGLLRFYLTPMRASRRGNGVSGKSRHNASFSITKTVLGIY